MVRKKELQNFYKNISKKQRQIDETDANIILSQI